MKRRRDKFWSAYYIAPKKMRKARVARNSWTAIQLFLRKN